MQTEIDQSRLFLVCESDLNGTIFLEDTEVLHALWTKSLVVTCNGVLCHWSATVIVQKYRPTLRSCQYATEKTTSSQAFQDCTGSLENGRDAERACAATVKTEHKQCCTYQAYPAENFLALNKKLIEVHFVLWQNSQTAC